MTGDFIIIRGRPGRSAVWVKKTLLCTLLAVMMAGAVVAAQWAIPWWKISRARGFSVEAARLVDDGQLERAMPLMLRAWRMAPHDPEIMRELARRFDEVPARASDAAGLWRQIVNSPEAMVDDSLRLAAALIRTSDAAAARVVLEGLPQDVRQRAGCLEVEADLLKIEGREQDSENLLEAALEKSPEDASSRFRLAQIHLNSVFAAVRNEARRVLWALGLGESKIAPKALLALASVRLTDSEISDIHHRVSTCASINSVDRLAILTACARQQPALAGELVLEESRRVKGRQPEDCAEFYEWLARLGMAGRILDDLSEKRSGKTDGPPNKDAAMFAAVEPKAAVLKSRELFLAYGDALVMTRNWKVFSALLEGASLPVGKEDVELMRAMCAKGTAQPVEVVDGHLAAALAFARNTRDFIELVRIANLAERLERPQLALQALSVLPSNKVLRLDLLQRTFRLQKAMDKTEDLLATADAILEIKPELVPYADEAVYLRLLTGRDIEPVLHKLSPERTDITSGLSPVRRLVWALSAFQCGSLDVAKRWLDGMNGSGLTVGQRAVFAGLLKETGREGEAYRIAEKLSGASILPEEMWYLKAALR